jgi:hypothetical protein
MAKNLVILRDGKRSIHGKWIGEKGKRNFDVWLQHYELVDDDPRADLNLRFMGGTAWTAMDSFYHDRLNEIAKYDYIWLPDDDIDMSHEDLQKFFDICARYKIDLAAPGLDPTSYWSHDVTLVDPSCKLRYTNFVEVMAPCFSRDAFIKLGPTFKECTSGWGLDHLWARQLKWNNIAVVDECVMRHTLPVQGGAGAVVPPWLEAERLFKKFDFKPEPFKVFKKILR